MGSYTLKNSTAQGDRQPKGSFALPKLKINTPGDSYEQEADSMAEKVMRMTEKDTISKPATGYTDLSIQRKPGEDGGDEAPADMVSKLNSSEGKGNSMPAATRKFMENAFNTDFSGVNIHSNNEAATMSKTIGARAFTYGNDVYFNQGRYNPDTKQGKHLLAHELTHVVQQKSSIGLAMRQIQRSVETWGGTWDTEKYAKIVPVYPGDSRGAAITLKFTPNDKVNAEKIGLSQTALAIKNNTPWTIDSAIRQSHAIKAPEAKEIDPITHKTDEKTHIDRVDPKNNPMYGSMSLLITTADIIESLPAGFIGPPKSIPANVFVQITEQPEAGKGGKLKVIRGPLSGTTMDFALADLGKMQKAGNLEDTPMDNNTTRDPTNIATNATYQLGYHYMDGKILKQADAKLRDRPVQSDTVVNKNSSNTFEVAAIGLKGVQAGIYFGSVKWGWSIDATGNHNLLPLKVSSNQVPSSSFLTAAHLWNAGKTSDGVPMVQLPIVDVNVTTAAIEIRNNRPPVNITAPNNTDTEAAGALRAIPTGTRVQIVKKDTLDILWGRTSITGAKIKIVDGPLTGTVADINIEDLAKLTPERPLPIVDVKVTTAPIKVQNNRPPGSFTAPINVHSEADEALHTIPTGTSVQIIEKDISDILWGRTSITGARIKIVDGPLTGNVADINIEDLAKLTP
jgi:hypothetical protein